MSWLCHWRAWSLEDQEITQGSSTRGQGQGSYRSPSVGTPSLWDIRVFLLNQETLWHFYMPSAKQTVTFNSSRPLGLQPARLLGPWISPGKNTRVGCRSFLQGIFPTQGLSPGPFHCRQIFYHLSHQGSPIDKGLQYNIGPF